MMILFEHLVLVLSVLFKILFHSWLVLIFIHSKLSVSSEGFLLKKKETKEQAETQTILHI